MVDGDDTYPAKCAPEMVKKVLERNVNMVVGDRLSSTYIAENKRLFHNFSNSLVRKSINILFQSDIKDIMIGYRASSYQFVKSFPIPVFVEYLKTGLVLNFPTIIVCGFTMIVAIQSFLLD